jgi:hypothetical protein
MKEVVDTRTQLLEQQQCRARYLTRSTRFTSTTVHILTPEDLRARAEAAVATERRQLAFAHKRLVRLEVGTLDIHFFFWRGKLTVPRGGDAWYTL